PAITSINPPSSSTASGTSLPYTNLVGYPYNGTAYSSPDRAHRNDLNYTNEYDNWNPKNGVGYWTWDDGSFQMFGTWIDTATKSGLVFLPFMANGRTWYNCSQLNAEFGSHTW